MVQHGWALGRGSYSRSGIVEIDENNRLHVRTEDGLVPLDRNWQKEECS